MMLMTILRQYGELGIKLRNRHKKKKAKWFFRLKTQFITAIGISLLISIITTGMILSVSSTMIETYFDENYNYDKVQLDMAYNQFEEVIVGGGLKPSEVDDLYVMFDQFPDFDFSLYVAEKDLDSNDVLIDYIVTSDMNASIESFYYENEYGLFIISAADNELNTAFAIVILAVLVIFVSVFVACIFVFVGQKQRYLFQIENGLERLAGGDLNHRIKIKGHDEIASVVRNINAMSEALKEKIDREKEVEQTKNELIANISHDLRTPLTSITGFLSLLKGVDDKNSLDALEYIDVALNKSTELAKLIEQLFDYVMLSNNQMDLNFETVDMSLVMKQSCFECKSLFEEDGFIVHDDIEAIAAMVKVDTSRFMRVINNLVQNIRKYANKSMVIEVKAYREGQVYKIHLINGLEEGADIDRDVFTRYFTSNRTDQKSIGLGLAICREIVHHHDGIIEAEIEDQWFEMVITLPLVEPKRLIT